jgi:hypothetical protein
MRINTIGLAAILALSSSVAMAQSPGGSAGGSSQAGGPAASKTTTGESMSGSTTGGGANMKNNGTGPAAQSSTPSAKEPSTQGASPAGAPDRKGDAASPRGVMKKQYRPSDGLGSFVELRPFAMSYEKKILSGTCDA